MKNFDLFLSGEKALLCKDDKDMLFFLLKIYGMVEFNECIPTVEKCYEVIKTINSCVPIVFMMRNGFLTMEGMLVEDHDILHFDDIYQDFIKYVTPERKKVKIKFLGI